MYHIYIIYLHMYHMLCIACSHMYYIFTYILHIHICITYSHMYHIFTYVSHVMYRMFTYVSHIHICITYVLLRYCCVIGVTYERVITQHTTLLTAMIRHTYVNMWYITCDTYVNMWYICEYVIHNVIHRWICDTYVMWYICQYVIHICEHAIHNMYRYHMLCITYSHLWWND